MADKKISALPAASLPLTGAELFPLVQTGSTTNVSLVNLQAAPVSAGVANAIQYLNASKVPTTYSAFIFNGTTVSIGTTPVAWAGGIWAIQLGSNTAIWNEGSVTTHLTQNAYYGGGATLTYLTTNPASDYQQYNGTHVWKTAPSGTAGTAVPFTTAMTLDQATSNLTLNAGNLVQGTAAKGVNFTANTPAAGMTSQLLNWYEQGTWTPTITAFSGTITTVGAVAGTYTRTGRLVTLSGSFIITTNGTGSVLLQVTGMPFPASGATVTAYAGSGICTSTGKTQSVQYAALAAKIYLADYDNTYSGANGRNFIFSVTYEV